MRISDYTLNRLTILKAIQRFGPVARTELPKLTGLSAGLITQQSSDLVKRALVVERKDGKSGRGRPRTFLEINDGGPIVIGASINGTGMLSAAFVSLSGTRKHLLELPFRKAARPARLSDLADRIGLALQEAIEQSPYEPSDIARVGIALPAVVDSVRGEVHYNTTFAPEVTPFAAPISATVKLPVTIENDMVCYARAEHWFGRARNHSDFTMIHVGFWLGSAVFENGLPKYGANGLNPEFGHVKTAVGDHTRRCLCGATGCLAAYSSMYGILEAAGLLRDVPFPPVQNLSSLFDQFVDQAQAGDESAAEAIRQAATHLGVAVANHVNMADPGQVFIAADNAKLLPLIEQHFHAALEANTLPGLLPPTRVEFFHTDADWRWKGAAAQALEQAYLGDR